MKALTVEIQHCGILKSDGLPRLVFARATNQGKKFEILDGGDFPINKCHGSIQLTQFSWFGIFCYPFNLIWYPRDRMYCALIFWRETFYLPNEIEIKFVICWDLDYHVQVGV